jgi:hypothetical protein
MRSTMLCWWLFLPALAGAQNFQQWNEVDFTASWRNANFDWIRRLSCSLPEQNSP